MQDNRSPAPQLVAVRLGDRRGWLLSHADAPVAPQTLYDAPAIATMAALFEAGVSCAEDDGALRDACAALSVAVSPIAHDGPFGEPWRVVLQPPSVRVFDQEGRLVCDVYGGEAAVAVADLIVMAVNGQAHIPTALLEGREESPWREWTGLLFTPWRVGTGRATTRRFLGQTRRATAWSRRRTIAGRRPIIQLVAAHAVSWPVSTPTFRPIQRTGSVLFRRLIMGRRWACHSHRLRPTLRRPRRVGITSRID